MDDCFEGGVGDDGGIEGTGNGDVGDEDVVEVGGIFGIGRDEGLSLFFCADGEADRVAVCEDG